jgi:hypothetical protein
VKTTPIDTLTLTTGNKPIQELIKEKAVSLHESIYIYIHIKLQHKSPVHRSLPVIPTTNQTHPSSTE